MNHSAESDAFASNPLLAYFVRNGGRIVHKWVDYFEVYHRVFERLRDGGGLRQPGSFHEYVKGLIDEMHAWYHAPAHTLADAYMARHLYSLAVYDSMVVMEKRRKKAPLALPRGSTGHNQTVTAMSHLDLRRACGVPDA